MKIRLWNYNNNHETYYDVLDFSLEYQEENGQTYWLFLRFKKDSPNYKKHLPYGECAIKFDPVNEILDVRED